MKKIVKWSKKNYFIALFLISLSLLWILYTYHDIIQYQTIKRVNYKKIDLDKQYVEKNDSKYKDIEIKLRLNLDKKTNVHDIIKTASSNQALVLRFVKPSSLQIVTGYKNPDGIKVFALTDTYDFNRPHEMIIRVTKEKQLWVFMDQILVTNILDRNIDFDIAKIQTAKNLENSTSILNIEYNLYKKSAFILIIKIILLILFLWTGMRLFIEKLQFLNRKQRIQYTSFILLTGFLMAIFYHFGQKQLGYTHPKDTFLFVDKNMFSDFLAPVNNPDVITYSFFTAIVKFFLYLTGAELSLTVFVIGTIATFALINMKEIINRNIDSFSLGAAIVFTLLSYPMLFVINRGNFEILVFILLYFFEYFLIKKKYLTSATYLALAISLKIFPAVFLIIFLSFKKFKALLYAGLLSLFLNLAAFGFFLLRTGKSIEKLFSDYLSIYTGPYIDQYIIDNRGLEFGHTLYGLLKLIVFIFNKTASITDVTLKKVMTIYSYYNKIQVVLFLIITVYILYIEKQLWKKITLLVIAMNLLPYVSADYKLINFFIPLYIFINKKEKSKYDLVYLILFSFLLVPKNYFSTVWHLPDTSLAIFLNPIFMIVLGLLIITDGLNRYFFRQIYKV